ncbi:hypothetical protein F2P45_17895 [Massilia sp. CCM 8733]|uniref:Uncharacterized protein n=1 Tax=Massilia mucilaginosa TaxID=2609282 RepID=A0ABX0NVY0_9BURK|nr:hypothetical protein [Massilia mucilaginosa]NHZ90881.1 hypothetical protein [Massilia mucilaginosa]
MTHTNIINVNTHKVRRIPEYRGDRINASKQASTTPNKIHNQCLLEIKIATQYCGIKPKSSYTFSYLGIPKLPKIPKKKDRTKANNQKKYLLKFLCFSVSLGRKIAFPNHNSMAAEKIITSSISNMKVADLLSTSPFSSVQAIAGIDHSNI